MEKRAPKVIQVPEEFSPITLFVCGDVMPGRGIDQILPHPGDPMLYESYMKSAKGYVTIAEDANGPIPYPVSWTYIWGDALAEFKRLAPDVRLINLETAITRRNDYWRNKGIHYRMHPANIACLTAAHIDCCSLANNHVIDWGYAGLTDTVETLRNAGIKSAGAGRILQDARAPAVIEIESKGRIIIFSYGSPTSGIPPQWAATPGKPGVNLLNTFSGNSVKAVREAVKSVRRPGDIIVVSLHWGGNWGYEIAPSQREFAHRLMDEAGVHIIHGHSSHHVMGLEVYHDKPIFYGCGDFLNDYEGIGGYEVFRADLGLMYFVTMSPSTGKLLRLQLIPTRIGQFKINRASNKDALWLSTLLNRESNRFGTRIELNADNSLTVRWK